MPATPAWPPKSLPRLFVRQPLGEGAAVELDAGQANYLGNVLRLKEGGELLVFDGASGEWLARIAEAGKKRMTLVVERRTREPEAIPDVWLAFAPVKRAQTDWLVEKATELGVGAADPGDRRSGRSSSGSSWSGCEAIAIEAAEQCGRTRPARDRRAAAARPPCSNCESARTLYFADEAWRRARGSGLQARPGDDPDRPRRRLHRRGARRDPRRAERRRRSRSARASFAPRPPRSPRSPPIWRSPGTGAKRRGYARPMTTRTDTAQARSSRAATICCRCSPAARSRASDWRIGTEHEKFVYRCDDHRAPSWDEPGGIRDLLDGADRVRLAAGRSRTARSSRSTGADGTISLEPAGQFELSGAALAEPPPDLRRGRPPPRRSARRSATSSASASSASACGPTRRAPTCRSCPRAATRSCSTTCRRSAISAST